MVLAGVRVLVQLLVEVVPLVVEVQHTGVVDKQRERTTHQRWIVPDHDMEDLAMHVREAHKEILRCFPW